MIMFQLSTPSTLNSLVTGAAIPAAAQAASIATAKELQAEARPYPGPAVHPIEWASEKQRRFYFVMRRERGMPIGYIRQSDAMSDAMSERLLLSWVVEPYGTTGALLKNNATYAPFVIGDQQQPFHANTGWRVLGKVAREFFSSGRAAQVFEHVFVKIIGRK